MTHPTFTTTIRDILANSRYSRPYESLAQIQQKVVDGDVERVREAIKGCVGENATQVSTGIMGARYSSGLLKGYNEAKDEIRTKLEE